MKQIDRYINDTSKKSCTFQMFITEQKNVLSIDYLTVILLECPATVKINRSVYTLIMYIVP